MACVKNEVRAAGIMIFRILNDGIEYLLLKSSCLEHHWTAPKGHLDPGETEIIAAQREVQEESGLRPEDYDIIDGFTSVLRYPVKKKPKRVTYWTGKVKDPFVPIRISYEHENYRWCNLSAVVKMTDKKDMQESYRNCENFLQKKLFNSTDGGSGSTS